MKKLLLIILLFSASFQIAIAQDDDKRLKKIEALKIAFITQKLELSPDDAQKFWPVYGNYETEMKHIIMAKQGGDVLDNDEKILNLRKKYRTEFVKVIGQPRMNKLFNAEREFRGVLIRHLQNKNNQQQRPMLRRGNR